MTKPSNDPSERGSALQRLLLRIRDGVATSEDHDRAAALVRSDERVPAELRQVVFLEREEAAADAAGLLAVLGADDFGQDLALAVAAESAVAADSAGAVAVVDDGWDPVSSALRQGLEGFGGDLDIAEAVMRRLPASDFVFGAVLAEAVRAEAGDVDVSGALDEWNGGIRAGDLAAAVAFEAGEIDIAASVATILGLPSLDIAAAVRAEAGRVDVVGPVMYSFGAPRVEPVPNVTRPANDLRGWHLGVVALAAAALFAVVAGRLSIPVGGIEPSADLRFARSYEVVVESLEYGADVQVFQMEGEAGMVILWVDEEA